MQLVPKVEDAHNYTKFAKYVKIMADKSQGNQGVRREAATDAQKKEMKQKVYDTISLAIKHNFLDDNMLGAGLSKLKKWFQLFDNAEKAIVITEAGKIPDQKMRDQVLGELKTLEVRNTSVGMRNNLYQMCYPFVFLLSCSKAGLLKGEAQKLCADLTGISMIKPVAKQVWTSLVKCNESAARVDKFLLNRSLSLHDHPSQVNSSRFITAALVLGGGVTELSMVNCDVQVGDLINLVAEISNYDAPQSTQPNSTTKTEHIIHMLCLSEPGDARRIRTGFKRSIRDVRVTIVEKA
jgi:hypothetical protein